MSVKIHVHEEGKQAIASRLGAEMLTDDPTEADFVVLPGQRGWVVIGDYDGTVRSVIAGGYDLGGIADVVVSLCQEA